MTSATSNIHDPLISISNNKPVKRRQQQKRCSSSACTTTCKWCLSSLFKRLSLHLYKNDANDHNYGGAFDFDPFNTSNLHERMIEMELCLKDVLQNHANNELTYTNDFVSTLLLQELDGENDDNHGDNHGDRYDEFDMYNGSTHVDMIENDDDFHYILKGVPQRPFYITLSVRIVLLSHILFHKHDTNRKQSSFVNSGAKETRSSSSSSSSRPLIDATKLGFTENQPIPIQPYAINEEINSTNVIQYLNSIQTNGILEYLGLRLTTGTIICSSNNNVNVNSHSDYLNHIPNFDTLIEASNQPCKPSSNPPRLTVAGRARAKHAHRGTQDQFFGVCKGSTRDKNDAAETIVVEMIHNAIWINVHVFGGIENPVLEIRIKEGYGARWSIENCRKSTYQNEVNRSQNVIFRGFLEPQMSGGFDKKWKH